LAAAAASSDKLICCRHTRHSQFFKNPSKKFALKTGNFRRKFRLFAVQGRGTTTAVGNFRTSCQLPVISFQKKKKDAKQRHTIQDTTNPNPKAEHLFEHSV
jgi:hypothetical protein